MNCPKCNFEIPEGTFFCGECGTKIDTTPLCKKCATPLNGGVLFCPNCGTPAASKDTAVSEIIPEPVIAAEPAPVKAETVPDTASSVQDEVKDPEADKAEDSAQTSAVKSREDIEEKLERTMTIPIIKQSSYTPERMAPAPQQMVSEPPVNPAAPPRVPVQTGAARGASIPQAAQQMRAVHPAPPLSPTGNTTLRQTPPEANVRKTKTKPSKKDDGQTQKNILIFLIVFLLVILIGLLSIILVMGLTKGDSSSDMAPKETQSEVKDEDSKKKEKKDKKDTKDKEDKKDKKSKKNTSSSLPPEDYIVKVDYDFDFAFGEDLDPEDYTTRRYMIYEDTDYFFECDVPSGFRHDFTDDVEVRYRASDNTAYMDIGAYFNDASLSVDDVMDNTVDTLGGTVSYEADGDDWFAVSHEKDGVVYYQKCFVDDDYIRYFEFVYPEEYSDIYDDYITDIEANYKRTE